jgi:hypothetical protein
MFSGIQYTRNELLSVHNAILLILSLRGAEQNVDEVLETRFPPVNDEVYSVYATNPLFGFEYATQTLAKLYKRLLKSSLSIAAFRLCLKYVMDDASE